MQHFWTVIEIQNNGTPGVITTVHTLESQAYNKYYTILAAASISAIAYHSAHMIRDDGVMVEGKVFDRRTESTGADS